MEKEPYQPSAEETAKAQEIADAVQNERGEEMMKWDEKRESRQREDQLANIDFIKEKILAGAEAEKSRSGFSLGQNYADSQRYHPLPVAFHGAYEEPGSYASEAIKNLIFTSLRTGGRYWEEVFSRWNASEEYKKFQMAFEPARKAAEEAASVEGSVTEEQSEVIARKILAENINLLPEEVIREIGDLYKWAE